jgi:arsenate reductase
MDEKKKILFLCTDNAAQSQMAEGFVNALYSDRYEAYSAGSEPTEVHPCAIERDNRGGHRHRLAPILRA